MEDMSSSMLWTLSHGVYLELIQRLLGTVQVPNSLIHYCAPILGDLVHRTHQVVHNHHSQDKIKIIHCIFCCIFYSCTTHNTSLRLSPHSRAGVPQFLGSTNSVSNVSCD